MDKITDLSLRLSPNFTMREATQSQVALRQGIDNNLPAKLLGNVQHVAQHILQPCRDFFGIPFSPSSFYRCPELCKKIGSSKVSQHTKGEAVDFEIPGISNYELAKWIAANLEFDQLILEYYKEGEPNSGWVHCSFTSTSNRHQVLRFDGVGFRHGLSSD